MFVRRSRRLGLFRTVGTFFGASQTSKTLRRRAFSTLGSRNLGSRSLRGHLARESSAWGHSEANCLEKTVRGNHSKKLFEGAVTAPLSPASLHSASSKTRMDILGFTLVYIYGCVHLIVDPSVPTKKNPGWIPPGTPPGSPPEMKWQKNDTPFRL